MARWVSSQTVISKIARDLKLESSGYISDFLEWMAEGIQGLGITPILLRKSHVATASMYNFPLPCDYHAIIGVWDADGNRVSEASYDRNLEVSEEQLRMGEDTWWISDGQHPDSIRMGSVESVTQYRLDGNTVKLTKADGEYTLEYLAFPVDDIGMPMMPDNMILREALYWRCIMKLLESGFRHPANINHQYAMQLWERYMREASGQILYPSIDTMERMHRGHQRLIFEELAWENSFRNRGTTQPINLK